MACQKPVNQLQYFTFTVSDELKPEHVLPEKYEVTGDGKLVILTNQFNKGKFIYQQTYFVELSRGQMDSVRNYVSQLTDDDLVSNPQNTNDSVIYKIKLDLLRDNNHRESFMLIGSRFSDPISELMSYCKTIPERDHLFSLKESYYFNTDEICCKQR